ncbi:MAG: hypothetical protein GW903_06325 [Alphaproteobacteria bacterium]|nr:hypothetical protein [Alphaproteobacteria bacterium]NCQ88497.1 hypothetical protein [Alphaproteobacteria bacterium]NCT06040.1 hypothetical protein [Alphaproteobacteria bacterium]
MSALKGGPLSKLARTEADLDNLIAYFLNINNYNNGPDFFQKQWESLDRFKLNPKQLSIIIDRSGQIVRDYESQGNDFGNQRAKELRKIVLGNLHRWEKQALGKMSEFDPVDLSHAIRGFYNLGIKPSQEFHKKWFAQIQERTGVFRPIDFGVHYSAAAYLGVQLPRSLASQLIVRLRECGNFLHGRNKTDFVWAIAIQDSIFPKTEYSEIAALIRPQLAPQSRGTNVDKMRYDVGKWFSWDETFQNPHHSPRTSQLEEDIRKLFERAGIKTEKREAPLPSFPQAVDFTAYFNKRPVHIEIDGPTHHIKTAGHVPAATMNPAYKGSDLFRSALLARETKTPFLRIPEPISYALSGRQVGNQRFGEECCLLIARSFMQKAANTVQTVSRAVILGTEVGIVPMIPSRP